MQILQNGIAHLEHARQRTISQTIKIESAITQWEVALLLNRERDLTPTCIYRCKIGGVRSLPLLRSIGEPSLSRRDVHRCRLPSKYTEEISPSGL